MGCLLSVSSNTCVNVVDLAAVGGLRDSSLYRRKKTSAFYTRCSAAFSVKRRGSKGSRSSPRRPRRPGVFVADALRNLQRAHSFRHGECYLCNYKNKSCNGVCIHREIFTSVKPGYYSNYYNKDSHEGVRRTGTLRASLHILPPAKENEVFREDSLSRDSVLRRSLRRSGSFKAKARRSMRSITAFPPDEPPPELGIKPQVSLRLSRHSLGRRDTNRSVASWEEREAVAILHDVLGGDSISGDSHRSFNSDDEDQDDGYELVGPPLPHRNNRKNAAGAGGGGGGGGCGGGGDFAPPLDLAIQSLKNKGMLTASDFGLVKTESGLSCPSPPFPKSLPSNPTYSSVLDPGHSSDNLTDSVFSAASEGRESPAGEGEEESWSEGYEGARRGGDQGSRPKRALPPLPPESSRGASPPNIR